MVVSTYYLYCEEIFLSHYNDIIDVFLSIRDIKNNKKIRPVRHKEILPELMSNSKNYSLSFAKHIRIIFKTHDFIDKINNCLNSKAVFS